MGRLPETPGLPDWARAARAKWVFRGQRRPPFAVVPGPGQQSVWDHPRPPACVRDGRKVVVRAGDLLLAETTRALRVLETASPPTFYVPPEDVRRDLLAPGAGRSRCEWKGEARSFDLALPGGRVPQVAWSYPEPFPEYAALAHHVAFHPGRVECYVAGTRAQPQEGGYYGGWITPELVGPWKGEAGTESW